MSKARSTGNLNNSILISDTGAITFVSGSTTLASFNTVGPSTVTSNQYISSSTQATGFTNSASLYTDGGMRVGKDAYVSGTLYLNNLTVYGTQSIQYITSSQLNISTNLITVNTSTPSVRFGGIAVQDSGSASGLTGSLLWDSQTNNWIYNNPSGSGNYDSAMVMMGPQNSSGLGNEVGITVNAIPKGAGGHHMTSSGMFESGSNIGIGTTSPTSKLHIVGTTGLPFTTGSLQSGSLRLQVAGYGTVLDFGAEGPATGKQWIQATNNNDLSVAYPLLLNPNGGTVTIGTTTVPSQNGGTLAGSTIVNGIMRVQGVSGRYFTSGDGLEISKTSIYSYNRDTSAYNDLGINDTLYAKGGGNVGIGTASPGYKLDVQNSSGGVFASTVTGAWSAGFLNHSYFMAPNMTGGGLSIAFGKSNGTYNVAKIVYNHVGDANSSNYIGLGFWDADNKLTVLASGKVGIGSTNPSGYLDVVGGSSSTTPTIYLSQGGYGQIVAQDLYHGMIFRGYPSNNSDYAATTTDVMSFYEYGGEFRFYQKYAGGLNFQAKISGGNIVITGTITQNGSPSDINLKENLVKISSPLEKISQINGYTFDWKEGSPARGEVLNIVEDAGLIAQEVEAILPQTVRENGDYKALNYNGVAALLVEAIKELKAENDTLKEILQRNNIQ